MEWNGLAGSDTGGGVSNTETESRRLRVAMDSTGGVFAAWEEVLDENSEAVRVSYFDGSVWQSIAGADSATDIASGARTYVNDIEVDSQDRALVLSTACPDPTSCKGALDRYGDSDWETLGQRSEDIWVIAQRVLDNGLTIDARDHPIVAWGPSEVFVVHFDGAEWEELDESATGGGVSNSEDRSTWPRVAATDDLVCVTWSEHNPLILAPEDSDKTYSGGDDYSLLMRCHELH